jgi:hypothetical protein
VPTSIDPVPLTFRCFVRGWCNVHPLHHPFIMRRIPTRYPTSFLRSGLGLRRSVLSLRTILARSWNCLTKLLLARLRQSVCLLRHGWRRIGRGRGCRVATHEARDRNGDGEKPNPGEPSMKRNQGDALSGFTVRDFEPDPKSSSLCGHSEQALPIVR